MKKYLFFALLPIFFACSDDPQDPTPDTQNSFQSQMLAQVNQLRASGCTCGSTLMPSVPAVSWDNKLATAAQKHANDMQNNSFLSHTGSDDSSFSERITREGYNWGYASENIASGQTSVTDVVNAWKASEGHCKNMMSEKAVHLGAARAGNYWVQKFAKPL